jgi:pimeloyl-ACP methyl ester carboxylesterase
LDRFCRILAAAGNEVIAPFIPAYLALVPDRTAIEDFTRVFEALPPGEPPTVFSISFGSLLAFALAASHGDAIHRLVIFGGYSDFHETLRFCLTGQVPSGRVAVRDPLNQPVVIMNLLDQLVQDSAHRDVVAEMWRTYVRRTWGRPEMKARERFVAIAEELAPSVPADVRELFLVGIGARDGAWDIARGAIDTYDASALDPSPYLPRVTNRVDLVHGVDDDVIPYEQSHDLAAKLTNAKVRVHVTGMYGHTGAQRPPLGALAKELATMVRVLRVLAG